MFVISDGTLNGLTNAFFVESESELAEAIEFFISETGCEEDQVCVNRVGNRIGTVAQSMGLPFWKSGND